MSLLYQGEARAQQAYQVEWQPPVRLPAGLYIIRFRAPGHDIRKKVLLAR